MSNIPIPPPPLSILASIIPSRYPPALDLELDDLDAGLSTLKTKTLGDSEEPDGEEPEQEECRVFPTPKAERREAKKKLRDEEKKIMVSQFHVSKEGFSNNLL